KELASPEPFELANGTKLLRLSLACEANAISQYCHWWPHAVRSLLAALAPESAAIRPPLANPVCCCCWSMSFNGLPQLRLFVRRQAGESIRWQARGLRKKRLESRSPPRSAESHQAVHRHYRASC